MPPAFFFSIYFLSSVRVVGFEAYSRPDGPRCWSLLITPGRLCAVHLGWPMLSAWFTGVEYVGRKSAIRVVARRPLQNVSRLFGEGYANGVISSPALGGLQKAVVSVQEASLLPLGSPRRLA